MKIYSWNVNGIRAVHKKGLFLAFLEAHEPDILCLQETKAERGQIEIELPDYREYWNSAVKKGYSGTAIFSKQEPLKIINGFPNDFAKRFSFADELKRDSAEEGRVITAEFARFFVVTVYTPNAKDDLSRLALRYKHWDPAFLAYCKQLEKTKPVIFCGDLNVAHTELDLANPKPNRGKKGFTDEERAGFQAFIDAGFVDTFRMFTPGQRPLFMVEPFRQFAGAKRRVENRLPHGLGGASRCREGRANPRFRDGQRSLSGEHFTRRSVLKRFQHRGNSLAAADALSGKGVASFGAREQGGCLAGDAGAGCAQRVPERQAAAIEIDLLGIELEFPNAGERLRGECLVDFDYVERLDLEGGARHGFASGRNRARYPSPRDRSPRWPPNECAPAHASHGDRQIPRCSPALPMRRPSKARTCRRSPRRFRKTRALARPAPAAKWRDECSHPPPPVRRIRAGSARSPRAACLVREPAPPCGAIRPP